MTRVSEARFRFEGDAFRGYCLQLTGGVPGDVLVDPARIGTVVVLLDRRIRNGSNPEWERFTASFPDLAPEPLRVALELSFLWPSQAAAAAAQWAARAHPGRVSLESFAHEFAAVLARTAVHGKTLAEVYDIVTNVGQRTRRFELPWKILAPAQLLPWPDVVVGYQGREGGAAVFGAQSSPLVASVSDRITPEDAQSTAAALPLITKLRSLIRDAQSTASDLYLEGDRTGNAGLIEAGQELIDPLRDARESIETTYDACVEFAATRRPKAIHQHQLYARLAEEFATAIAKLTERAARTKKRKRALLEAQARRSAAGSADGIYSNLGVEGARRLMKALYGVVPPPGFLKGRVQDRQERRLAPRKPRKD